MKLNENKLKLFFNNYTDTLKKKLKEIPTKDIY